MLLFFNSTGSSNEYNELKLFKPVADLFKSYLANFTRDRYEKKAGLHHEYTIQIKTNREIFTLEEGRYGLVIFSADDPL